MSGSDRSLHPVAMDMSVTMDTSSASLTPSVPIGPSASGVGMIGRPMSSTTDQTPLLQSQLSGSSGITEYSVTGESPVRPGSRSESQPSGSSGSQRVMSAAPSLTESSFSFTPSQLISGSSQSQTDNSFPENTGSSDMGSLDLTRVEGHSLDLSSGRSSDLGSSEIIPVPGTSRSPQVTNVPVSMDTDGSLDLSKSAAALSTLQPVPRTTSSTNAG